MTQAQYDLRIQNMNAWINYQDEYGDIETAFEAWQEREEFISQNKVSERKSGYGTNGEYWEE